MEYSAHVAGSLGAHYLYGVGLSVPRMYDKWQVQFPRETYLPFEYLFLYVPRRVVVVIVKAGLAAGNKRDSSVSALLERYALYLVPGAFAGGIFSLMRVDSEREKKKVVLAKDAKHRAEAGRLGPAADRDY